MTICDRRLPLGRALEGAVDHEDGFNRARLFAAEQKFLLGVRILGGAISPLESGAAFAGLADVMLAAMLDWVRREFELRHGIVEGASMAIVAMGNLGTGELTAGSDLDLMVLYEFEPDNDESNGDKPLHALQYFSRLTQRLIAAMSAPTAEGVIYELDFRLRPSGNSGPLATTLSSFVEYQGESAWTWEKLALTRARVVAGDEGFAEKAQKAIDGCLRVSREDSDVSKDVREMRAVMDEERPAQSPWDIKLAAGGLIDIEFIAQWAVLTGRVENAPTTRAVIGLLEQSNDIAAEAQLAQAYDFYTCIIQMSRICLDETFSPDTAPAGLLTRVLSQLNLPDAAHADAALGDHQKRVRAAFKALLREK